MDVKDVFITVSIHVDGREMKSHQRLSGDIDSGLVRDVFNDAVKKVLTGFDAKYPNKEEK